MPASRHESRSAYQAAVVREQDKCVPRNRTTRNDPASILATAGAVTGRLICRNESQIADLRGGNSPVDALAVCQQVVRCYTEMKAIPALSYRQVRLAWCKATLVSLLRRWGIYIGVGLLILGGGGASAAAAMMAMAAWSVTPIFQAAQQSVFYGAVFTVAYALFGGMIVLGLCPWLWPRAWAEAERALPIDSSERRRSDVTVIMLGLTPLFAIYTLGTGIWLVQFPAWFQEIWARGTFMLTVSMTLSVVLGVGILHWRRGLPEKSTPVLSYRRGSPLMAHQFTQRQSLSATIAVVILPLVRGPAQRSGRFFVLTLVLLGTCAAATIALPHFASWCLAAFAAIAQMMVTRLNVVVSADMEPLHEACAALPVNPVRLKVARQAVVMLPLAAGQLFLIGAIYVGTVPVKPSVFVTYLLAILLGNLALVVAASARPAAGVRYDPAARVSWWIVILVLCVAVASEVVP